MASPATMTPATGSPAGSVAGGHLEPTDLLSRGDFSFSAHDAPLPDAPVSAVRRLNGLQQRSWTPPVVEPLCRCSVGFNVVYLLMDPEARLEQETQHSGSSDTGALRPTSTFCNMDVHVHVGRRRHSASKAQSLRVRGPACVQTLWCACL